MSAIDYGELREHVETAVLALDRWATHATDTTAGARIAANVAVECIDAAARELYRIRGELVGQIRAYDDATATRTDALLTRIRAERELAGGAR